MNKSYLALGDSYTIGEQVLPKESFPFKTIQLLNNISDNSFDDPEIIARTGWTTDELQAAINAAGISKKFDLVSLLIGVNNQYRGRSLDEYKLQFENLLKQAIDFADKKNNHVFVLSIPDWGVTPFANGRNRKTIAKEIDDYNEAAENICKQYGVVFIDITDSQRIDGHQPEFLAEDLLHPSGKEYAKWAEKLVSYLGQQ